MAEYGQFCGQCELFEPFDQKAQSRIDKWKQNRLIVARGALSEGVREDGELITKEFAEGVRIAIQTLKTSSVEGYRGCEGEFQTRSDSDTFCTNPDRFSRKF